jgi:hypothetical protein
MVILISKDLCDITVIYLRNLRVLVVCTRLAKIHQHIAESSTARGILATNI